MFPCIPCIPLIPTLPTFPCFPAYLGYLDPILLIMVAFKPQAYSSLLGFVSLISQILATPLIPSEASAIYARDDGSGLIILDQYAVPGGNITIYGDDPNAVPAPLPFEDPAAVQRRCGSNTIACFASWQAYLGPCSELISYMRDHPRNTLPTSPRSICMQTIGFQCCVSWANNVNNIELGFLEPAASKTYDTCRTSDSLVSGKAHDANLNGVCTTQCLSERPDGCKA